MKILSMGAEQSQQTDGKTLRHDKTNIHFSQLCECA